jgi:hypothetical protein
VFPPVACWLYFHSPHLLEKDPFDNAIAQLPQQAQRINYSFKIWDRKARKRWATPHPHLLRPTRKRRKNQQKETLWMTRRSDLASIILENSYLKKYGVLDIAVGPSATHGRWVDTWPAQKLWRRWWPSPGCGSLEFVGFEHVVFSRWELHLGVEKSHADHFKLIFTRQLRQAV